MKLKKHRKDTLIAFKMNEKLFKSIQDAADKYADGNVSMLLRLSVKEYLERRMEK